MSSKKQADKCRQATRKPDIRHAARPAPRRRATTDDTLTALQERAKSLGIPFGGLPKAKLVEKINAYYSRQ